MFLQSYELIIQTIANYLGLIVIVFMTMVQGIKIIQAKRKEGKFNILRAITFAIFVTLTWVLFWEFLYESTGLNKILSEEITISINTISLYSFGIGLTITLALGWVFYANRYKPLYFSSLIIYAVVIIIFFLTRNNVAFLPYVFIGGTIAVVFLYVTGFRLKDNGALGLAIFSTLIFPTLIAEKTIIGQILSLCYPIFGIILILGYFKPYKKEKIVKLG